MTVTLVGGGNSGHVCAALFHENTKGKVRTQLLTSNPQIWHKKPVVTFPSGETQEGQLDLISSDPRNVLPNADLVLWTGPINQTKRVFENLSKHIDPKKTVVGTIFAQGLVHMQAVRAFGNDVRFVALRNIPWLCRLTEKGRSSEIVGPKSEIEVVAINVDEAWVKSHLEALFVVQKTGRWEPVMKMMPDFCPIVFNPANQIIHPARYWALFRGWTGAPLVGEAEPSEWLYRGMDEMAGQVLACLDEELQAIKDAYHAATGFEGCNAVVSLEERLLVQYGDQIVDKSTLAKMVGTNKAYAMAKTPVIRTKLGVMPNPNHRVVMDDIGWGLCVLLSIAERLSSAGLRTSTTMMRMLIEWHQNLMGKEYVVNGKLEGRDIKELVLLGPNDPLEMVARPPLSDPSNWLMDADVQSDEHRIGNP